MLATHKINIDLNYQAGQNFRKISQSKNIEKKFNNSVMIDYLIHLLTDRLYNKHFFGTLFNNCINKIIDYIEKLN